MVPASANQKGWRMLRIEVREGGGAPSSNLRVFGGNMLRASLGGFRRKDLFQGHKRNARGPIQDPRLLEMLFREQPHRTTVPEREALCSQKSPHDPAKANHDGRRLDEGFAR